MDVLSLVAKLAIVDWIEVLQATIRLWSLGHDEGILRRAVDQLGRGTRDPSIVEDGLDFGDSVGRGAGRDARGVFVVEIEVGHHKKCRSLIFSPDNHPTQELVSKDEIAIWLTMSKHDQHDSEPTGGTTRADTPRLKHRR